MRNKRIPVRLTKEFEFEAGHSLVNYDGPCHNFHGHSYKLLVTVQGIPDNKTGLVIDFKNLKEIVKESVVDPIDHTNLNDSMVTELLMKPEDNTTCENMIVAIWSALDHEISDKYDGVKLMQLDLYETRTGHATLTRDMVYDNI